ncbi:MAG: response regulator transcription factor, partial [bacterium]
RALAPGLSNREIGERLFMALDTVKGHNRRILERLQVKRRTEAVARALSDSPQRTSGERLGRVARRFRDYAR